MRHPVSTPVASSRGEDELRRPMPSDVVRGVILPAPPQDADPRPGKDPNRVRVIAAATERAGVDGGRPGGGVARVVGKGGERVAEALVAGPAKDDGVMLAGGVGDGRDAGFGGELFVRGEAGAVIAQLGEDLRGVHGTTAGQALNEWAVGMVSEGGGDRRAELLDLRDEGHEDRDEAADDLAAGVGFRLPGLAGGRATEARQQLGGRAPAGVAVLGEELREPLLAEV